MLDRILVDSMSATLRLKCLFFRYYSSFESEPETSRTLMKLEWCCHKQNFAIQRQNPLECLSLIHQCTVVSLNETHFRHSDDIFLLLCCCGRSQVSLQDDVNLYAVKAKINGSRSARHRTSAKRFGRASVGMSIVGIALTVFFLGVYVGQAVTCLLTTPSDAVITQPSTVFDPSCRYRVHGRCFTDRYYHGHCTFECCSWSELFHERWCYYDAVIWPTKSRLLTTTPTTSSATQTDGRRWSQRLASWDCVNTLPKTVRGKLAPLFSRGNSQRIMESPWLPFRRQSRWMWGCVKENCGTFASRLRTWRKQWPNAACGLSSGGNPNIIEVAHVRAAEAATDRLTSVNIERLTRCLTTSLERCQSIYCSGGKAQSDCCRWNIPREIRHKTDTVFDAPTAYDLATVVFCTDCNMLKNEVDAGIVLDQCCHSLKRWTAMD